MEEVVGKLKEDGGRASKNGGIGGKSGGRVDRGCERDAKGISRITSPSIKPWLKHRGGVFLFFFK